MHTAILWIATSGGFLATSTAFTPLPDHRRICNQQNTLLHAIPNWSDLSSILSSTPPPFTNIDSALNPTQPTYCTERPTLFRERHGWCPYSERVWLTLEHFNIPHDTIRIDNTGPGQRPSYFSGTTPQIRWEDGRIQGESMDLIEELDDRYKTDSFSASDVQEKVNAFRNIFPKGARPSSRAAFLFSWNGQPLFKSDFETVLGKTNDLLSETTGPFFCGDQLSAADIAWVPFLERYAAQLPCLHEGLDPKHEEWYPYLNRWYEAMENLPAYACRIKGDASSWRKVLTMAGYGNAGVPPDVLQRMDQAAESEAMVGSTENEKRLWKEYAKERSYVEDTASKEAAATILRNRNFIRLDVEKRAGKSFSLWGDKLPKDEEELDVAMRALTWILIQEEGDGDDAEDAKVVKEVPVLASFLDERMCVPRDMGAMSAASIKKVAFELGS